MGRNMAQNMGTNNGAIGSNYIEYCQGLGVYHDISFFF